MVAGAPFFFSLGDGEGFASGVSFGEGVTLGLGDSSGVGDDEALCFFFFGEPLDDGSGDMLAELVFFFFFGEADAPDSGVSSGGGLEAAFFFFPGEGVGVSTGVAVGFGDGDFSALSFFFAAVELLRCFRGGGVGVGAKTFLILSPNDSSARAEEAH